MPRRALELLVGIARRGAAGMPHVGEGAGSPFANPRQKLRSAGPKRHPGGFSFGDFSLAKQRKVTRLSGRDPTPKQPVAPATQPLHDSTHYTLRLNDQYPATPTPNNQNAPGSGTVCRTTLSRPAVSMMPLVNSPCIYSPLKSDKTL
jgi:hypothetical protein